MHRGIFLLVIAFAACSKPSAGFVQGGPCPAEARALPASGACTCRPEAAAGKVWGTAQYLDASSVCAAARHAGAIDSSSGQVLFARSFGCDRYVGSTRHGVASSSHGSWNRSIFFPAVAAGDCTQAFREPGTPDAPPPRGAKLTETACPDVLRPPADGVPSQVTCHCYPARLVAGPVWGAGPYTLDSNVCAAALHAGRIDPARGGSVRLEVITGCASYPGRVANTIAGRGSEGTARAFRFDADACAAPFQPTLEVEAVGPGERSR